jgi:hypothetical protein
MIYRFKKPIKLNDGTWIGNNDPAIGPLGGECFFDKDEDNEIQQKVKAQVALEAEQEAAKEAKKKK